VLLERICKLQVPYLVDPNTGIAPADVSFAALTQGAARLSCAANLKPGADC